MGADDILVFALCLWSFLAVEILPSFVMCGRVALVGIVIGFQLKISWVFCG